MSIHQQFLWPLAGVLLGWLLSAISGGWRSRVERKKLIGRVLSKLLVVSGDVYVLKTASDQFKDLSDGPIQYERLRQRLYSNHFLQPTEKYQDLLALATSLSDYYPFEATRLQATLHILMKAKDAKLEAASNHKEAYIRILSLHEVGIDACDKELTRIVSSLALRHGVRTRLKLWLDRRRKNALAAERGEFLLRFSKETIDATRDRP
ncbi:hypothetical protein [Stenotrophomonas maltophilia]|uniref:hypothetical protein n=1 Tax=Stenotrophomonas maltophilia TaxID=40324 RepID=UPI0021CA95C6|nr:hypothetical protein [Stenotrophomonas maltophilia]MCU1064051.1 hypothetical protein [Stenotrophomonas maltophilia]